jgi:hypothetical protein
VKKLVSALVLVLSATLLVAVSAHAAGPIDLHNVNLRNSTIPGSTCRSGAPIQLHHGHGKGGKWAGQQLFADSFGQPVYADLTHDGQDEALLYVLCSTGDSMGGSEYRSNYVAFTGGSGQVKALGVIYPKHQWLNAHATIIDEPNVSAGVVTVLEKIWFTDDPSCCGRGRATTKWWFHNGALRVKSTHLKITDRIVSSTRVGHAALGDTVAKLKAKYGTVQSKLLANGGCRIYWHGKAAKSFGALIDPSSNGKVYGIYAPRGAVTLAGVGSYATVAQIKHAYAGHTVKTGTNAAGKQLYVKFAHSWIAFTLEKQDGFPAYVTTMRIGTHAFVTGAHTCSS